MKQMNLTGLNSLELKLKRYYLHLNVKPSVLGGKRNKMSSSTILNGALGINPFHAE